MGAERESESQEGVKSCEEGVKSCEEGVKSCEERVKSCQQVHHDEGNNVKMVSRA